MHAHFEQVEWGPIYLAAGATTVRDCGNEFEFITAVRDAIANGRGLGPRLLLAGIVDGTSPLSLGVERVDTPEQAKLWTDRYHDANFQQMKIYSSVQLDDAEDNHRRGPPPRHVRHRPHSRRPQCLSRHRRRYGPDQSHRVHRRNHVFTPARQCFPPRSPQSQGDFDLNSPEAKKAISFLVEHGTVIDPTLALFELYSASSARPVSTFEPGLAKVAPELIEELSFDAPPTPRTALIEKVTQKDVEIVGALHRAGVPIVAGTDQAVPGHSLHREVELYVQAGFTPMEAIQSATIVPARVMGVDKEVGTVEVGKRADLVILTANPLESIHNIRTVEFVSHQRHHVQQAELWRSVGFKP